MTIHHNQYIISKLSMKPVWKLVLNMLYNWCDTFSGCMHKNYVCICMQQNRTAVISHLWPHNLIDSQMSSKIYTNILKMINSFDSLHVYIASLTYQFHWGSFHCNTLNPEYPETLHGYRDVPESPQIPLHRPKHETEQTVTTVN